MQIDGQKIPEKVIEMWMAAIEKLSPQEVRQLAANRSSVVQGFRPGSIDIKVACERLKSVMLKAEELPVDIRSHLHGSGLATSLLIVFSTKALERIVSPLAAFFGEEAVAAALFLDERQAVRALGKALLENRKFTDDAAKVQKDAAAKLVSEVGPFLRHIRELLAYYDLHVARVGNSTQAEIIAPDANAACTLPTSARAPRPAREANLVVALRAKRQEANRLSSENQKLTARLNIATVRASASLNRINELEAQLTAVRTALSVLESKFDTRVEEATLQRLDSKLLPWLKPAEDIAQAAHSLGILEYPFVSKSSEQEISAEPEAIQQGRRLLARQAESDRKFGLRSALHAERDRCKALLDRLVEAQTDSIRPLAELTEGIHSLESRIQQIDESLGINTKYLADKSQSFMRLEMAVAEASTLDKLSVLRRHLINSQPLGLLDEKELDYAFALLNEASSKIYALEGIGLRRTVDTEELSGVPLYALQTVVSRGKACTLVVDGHNVLWKVPKLFREYYERGQPGAHARKAIESALLKLAERHPNLSIHLWFDSNVMEDFTLAANLSVHFSGGEGANRADRQILAYLDHIRISAPDGTRALVTADSEVADSGQASGALVLTPQELAIWLS